MLKPLLLTCLLTGMSAQLMAADPKVTINDTYCDGRATMATGTYDAVRRHTPKEEWLRILDYQRKASPTGSLLWSIVPQAKLDADEIYAKQSTKRDDIYINHYRVCMTFAGRTIR